MAHRVKAVFLKLVNLTNRIGFIEDELKELGCEIESDYIYQARKHLDTSVVLLRDRIRKGETK